MTLKIRSLLSGCALIAACATQQAHAFENYVSPYPAGATANGIASLPPIPGLFMLQQFSYTFANALYGNDGNKLPIQFRSSAPVATTRLIAAYPVKFLGADVYSQLVLPVVSLHMNIAGQSSTQNGLANITVSPVILQWRPSSTLTLATGLDLMTASGSYSPSKNSVAVGYSSLQPVFAIRYNNPDGFDVGLSNRLMINQTNRDTNYHSGSAYVGEFTVGWNFGPWKVGAVGAYLNQFTDDAQSGVTVGAGNRARSFAMGPSVSYDGRWFNVAVNYQQGLYAANTAKSSSVWLNIAIPLL
ncbi:transporter [Pandoraea nosoerga]|uniref:Phenol degradation protein meta n=1 Tax=Pandoraea nosoerga TaxID=2508296 RepID=A0A5E4RDT0_9BURK|nr:MULTISPECIES: transporter [Pandoraea]MBN4666716.1 transporter [Pandoraea nosoerga]MBN4676864.1 transporter [Pandoraea nosoerga]MBN4681529.1 transporter [Pandoraea nosoerga]MBN4745983.1 transporter [Pandoraea nosoerga]VVD60624.1 hypothetical protein PNO31109_00080 [Pandoraea nosoerga]